MRILRTVLFVAAMGMATLVASGCATHGHNGYDDSWHGHYHAVEEGGEAVAHDAHDDCHYGCHHWHHGHNH